jgi:hypothetical protein
MQKKCNEKTLRNKQNQAHTPHHKTQSHIIDAIAIVRAQSTTETPVLNPVTHSYNIAKGVCYSGSLLVKNNVSNCKRRRSTIKNAENAENAKNAKNAENAENAKNAENAENAEKISKNTAKTLKK